MRKSVKQPAKKKPSKQVKAGTSKAEATQRKKDFVNMYFIHNQNATQAMKVCGYSEKSAGSQAGRMLQDVWVIEEIKRRRDQLSEYIALTAEEVMRSLGRAMRFDPGKLYDANGNLLKIHEIDEDTRLELEGADVEQRVSRTGGVTINTSKVRYAKKSTARDQAMKHFRLFPSEKEHGEGDDEVPTPVSITIDFRDARLKPKE